MIKLAPYQRCRNGSTHEIDKHNPPHRLENKNQVIISLDAGKAFNKITSSPHVVLALYGNMKSQDS